MVFIHRYSLILRLDLWAFVLHIGSKAVMVYLLQLNSAAATLHYFFLQAEMYTEDAVNHNTALEDKSQPQREPYAERQVQTIQANTDPQTTREG